jgi:hypothetical protein
MFGQLFAGTGLGLLVGILVGLSSSPVVSAVVGALTAGMVTLLGFTRATKEGGPILSPEGSVFRLGSFGVACAIAVGLGLYIRTHNLASPSIADQVAEVQKGGYTPEEARRWVAYKNVGTVLTSSAPGSNGPAQSGNGTASVAGSVLFSGSNAGECQHFDTTKFKDAKEQLYALRQLGDRYAEYAEKISTLDAAQQKQVLDSLRLLFCAQ